MSIITCKAGLHQYDTEEYDRCIRCHTVQKRLLRHEERVIKARRSSKLESDWEKRFDLSKILFPEQLAFVQDPEPFKVAVCSRRAGKTVACAADLIDTALRYPDTLNMYITMSKKNAKRIVWKDLLRLNREYKLGGDASESELVITFGNGSSIQLVGANDSSEIENFRGLPIKKCYIDECQSFRSYIEDLIDDVIGPALIDYAGSLCLIGTPGPLPTGYFHKCSTDQTNTWSKHHWTYWQNPYIPIKSGKTHQQALERELKRRGVTIADPSIQREWFGKWILDSDSLWIKYKENIAHYETLPIVPPTSPWCYIIGCDLGFEDADALCVLAYNDLVPDTYLVEEKIETKQGLTELVSQINELRLKYPNTTKIMMDMGGLGKKIGEEIIRRYGIPVEAADKVRKQENVSLLNDSLQTGRFKAKKTSRFAQDTYLVEIDKEKSRPDKIAVSSKFHSDIIDAVLYAFKCSPAYAYVPPDTAKPRWGTKEWAESQPKDMWEAELAGTKQELNDVYALRGEFNKIKS